MAPRGGTSSSVRWHYSLVRVIEACPDGLVLPYRLLRVHQQTQHKFVSLSQGSKLSRSVSTRLTLVVVTSPFPRSGTCRGLPVSISHGYCRVARGPVVPHFKATPLREYTSHSNGINCVGISNKILKM